jgi:hypothetical protein
MDTTPIFLFMRKDCFVGPKKVKNQTETALPWVREKPTSSVCQCGSFFFFFFLTAPVFRQSCWTAVLPYIPISNSSASLYPSRVLLINTIGGLAIATVERCCFLDNRFVVPAHSRDRSLIIGGVFFSSGVCLCVK